MTSTIARICAFKLICFLLFMPLLSITRSGALLLLLLHQEAAISARAAVAVAVAAAASVVAEVEAVVVAVGAVVVVVAGGAGCCYCSFCSCCFCSCSSGSSCGYVRRCCRCRPSFVAVLVCFCGNKIPLRNAWPPRPRAALTLALFPESWARTVSGFSVKDDGRRAYEDLAECGMSLVRKLALIVQL